MTNDPNHTERIIQDLAIVGGRPVVNGTRIPVEVVLDYLAHNPSVDELFADYPRLTMDDVKACFAYAHRLVAAEQSSEAAVPASA